jgi:hypothetical protein
MIASDLLLVGAEVSVAFAGFSGIIATFQFRDKTTVKRGDIVALTMIVYFSLLCAFCCILPLLLSIFGIEDATIWTICSVFGAIVMVCCMYGVDRGMRNAVRKKSLQVYDSQCGECSFSQRAWPVYCWDCLGTGLGWLHVRAFTSTPSMESCSQTRDCKPNWS